MNRFFLFFTIAVAFGLCSLLHAASSEPKVRTSSHVLDLEEYSAADLMKILAEKGNYRFLYVKDFEAGLNQIIKLKPSGAELEMDDLYSLFLNIIRLHGFAVVESNTGKGLKQIVQIDRKGNTFSYTDAITVPLLGRPADEKGELRNLRPDEIPNLDELYALTFQFRHLRNLDSGIVPNTNRVPLGGIRRLLSITGKLEILGADTVLLKDYGSNLLQAVKALEQIDQPESNVEAIPAPAEKPVTEIEKPKGENEK